MQPQNPRPGDAAENSPSRGCGSHPLAKFFWRIGKFWLDLGEGWAKVISIWAILIRFRAKSKSCIPKNIRSLTSMVMSLILCYCFLNFVYIKYVYARETRRQIRNEEEFWTIVMNSVLHDSVPHADGAIRVSDYHQSLVLTKHGKEGTKSNYIFSLFTYP